MVFASLFFKLLCGHALADYALQSEYMAKNKRRATALPGQWLPTLAAHGLIHGGFVVAITGSAALGLAEAIAHTLIDLGKCEGHYGSLPDQAAHLLCKVAWAWLAVSGAVA